MPSIARLTLPSSVFTQISPGVSQLPLPPPVTRGWCVQRAAWTPRKQASPSARTMVPGRRCCCAQACTARRRKPTTGLSRSRCGRPSAVTWAAARKGVLRSAPRPRLPAAGCPAQIGGVQLPRGPPEAGCQPARASPAAVCAGASKPCCSSRPTGAAGPSPRGHSWIA